MTEINISKEEKSLNDKINYHFGYNFSDPLATLLFQNYLKKYKDEVDIDNLYSIVDKKISIRSFKKEEFIDIIKAFSKTEIFFDGDDYIFIKDGSVYKTDYSSRQGGYADIDVYVYSSTIDEAKKKLNLFDDFLSSYKIDIESFSIDWKYKEGTYSTTEYVDDIIHEEAYPNIKNLDTFVTDYINSPESVLILRGKTGSGKTRLIRSILREIAKEKRSCKVTYTMDDNLLVNDGFFVDFLNSTADVLVLEDLDEFLGSRKEGNHTMSKLLTVSDGIIQSLNKKIIISTNLDTVGEFDSALLRSGRCFANIRFRKLSWYESKELFLKLNPDFDLSSIEKQEYSVADIYEKVSGKNIDVEQKDEEKYFDKRVGFSN